jgi:hypothetical protein
MHRSTVPHAAATTRAAVGLRQAPHRLTPPQQQQGRRAVATHASLKDNVKLLPNIDSVAKITLQPLAHEIPNKEGVWEVDVGSTTTTRVGCCHACMHPHITHSCCCCVCCLWGQSQAGKKASVAIYNHLALKYDGRLTPAAASEGLQLYAEVVDDAKARPGAHPNIDILLQVVSKHQQQQANQQEGEAEEGQQQQQQQHADITIVVTKL